MRALKPTSNSAHPAAKTPSEHALPKHQKPAKKIDGFVSSLKPRQARRFNFHNAATLQETLRYRLSLAILTINLRNMCEGLKQFHIFAKHVLPVLRFGQDDANTNNLATRLSHQRD